MISDLTDVGTGPYLAGISVSDLKQAATGHQWRECSSGVVWNRRKQVAQLLSGLISETE